ncbi:MAG: hypothetical protein DI539_10620 [Flavobacterium psychrophilum]|nr:MAG: hypothetical protein DI539_10620 [Flavobacterium psychrophilum]
MKKRLLLGMMLMGAFAANAQITDGSAAPEISGNRILSVDNTTNEVTYGELISIQAYLDAGKTVVMDGSATWCGPCWSLHNSHTLEDLYKAYGPEGSDELRVIFVEADPSTAVSELGGVNQPPVAPYTQERGNPQGNWLEGVPYPVINSDDLVKTVANGGYGLNAFPTIYAIVPSGTVGQPGILTNLAWDELGNMVTVINSAREDAGLPAMVGVDNYGKIQAQDLRYCEAEGTITGYVTSTFGHTITSAQVQLKKDGEVLATTDFTTNIGGYATGTVDFTGYELDADADYQMVLLKVNGQDPLTQDTAADFTSEEFNVFPLASIESGINITATVHTDNYPAEMRWGIYNSAGQFVYISPQYQNTAANKNKTFTYNVNPTGLLDPIDCYGITLVDSYGDGWVDGTTGTYGMTLRCAGTVLFTTNGDIGSGLSQDATFKTNGLLANDTFETSSFAVYPNPSNGIFSFSTEETIDVTVTDLTGKTVHTAKGIENGGSINLSGLSTGMYIAKINGASGERVEKLIIK